jgi:hypothetical protein
MNWFDKLIDERFLHHRQTSTSLAGRAGVGLAIGLFVWNYYIGHVVRWDLLAVGVTFAVVKFAILGWHLARN